MLLQEEKEGVLGGGGGGGGGGWGWGGGGGGGGAGGGGGTAMGITDLVTCWPGESYGGGGNQ